MPPSNREVDGGSTTAPSGELAVLSNEIVHRDWWLHHEKPDQLADMLAESDQLAERITGASCGNTWCSAVST
jgi:hypothetical protein